MADDEGAPRGGLRIPGWAYVTSGVAIGVTAQHMWPVVSQNIKSFAENAFERFCINKRSLEESSSTTANRNSISLGGVVGRHYEESDDTEWTSVPGPGRSLEPRSLAELAAEAKRVAQRRAASEPGRPRVDPEDDNPDDEEIKEYYARIAELERKRKRRTPTTASTEIDALQGPAGAATQAVTSYELRVRPRKHETELTGMKGGEDARQREQPARGLAIPPVPAATPAVLEHNPANQTPCHPDGEPSEEEVGLVVAALDAACQAYAEEIKTAQEPIKVISR